MKLSAATLSLCLWTLLETNVYLTGTCSPAGKGSGEDSFTIQHSSSLKCLDVNDPANFSLATCDPSSTAQLWKWGSGHRLFHVASSLCLALDVQLKKLSLVDCGSGDLLAWHCQDGAVYTVYDMGLTVSEGKPGVRRDVSENWSRGGSQENICHRTYRVLHSFNGNSAGAPCVFPFKFNGSWYHECLPDPDAPKLTWCSTSLDYDQERKWGNCLIPENGCHTLFSGPEGDSCYEFVSGSTVTWHEALDSCRSQGADLLSLSESDDLESKTLLDGLGQMAEKMWIGLHQLDLSQGWQWSDGSPLSVLRWEPGMSISWAVCGVLNSKKNYEPMSCYERLPYVCKKKFNASDAAASELDVYKETVCTEGWVPWSGWCYKLVNISQNFSDAQQHCNSTEGGDLAAFHNIDTKEMISTYFHAGSKTWDVWIGLTGTGANSTIFKWTHQGTITFTYWDQNQPSQPTEETSCVFYSGEAHMWQVGNCTDKLPFMCQKKGEVNESAVQAGCSWEDGWRRHGSSCYQVNTKQVYFKDRCSMTIRNRFEQSFINRLLREHISKEPQYFWIGMQDIKSNGQYQWMSQDGSPGLVTFTNWGLSEPGQDGGCAVTSTEMPLGRWEVKNCTLFRAGTICRTDLSPLPEPEPEPELDPNATCPDGWKSGSDVKYCYKVFHEERLSRKRSWEEALSFCRALGADLPSFRTRDEMEVLHTIMRDSISDNRYFWVGLNRRNPADPSWQWSDGRPVSLDVLHREFHEDDAYNRDCAAFKSMRNSLNHLLMYLIHDIQVAPFFATPFHCDARLEWVCQIPLGKKPQTPPWYNPGGHHNTSIFIDGSEFWFVKEPKLTFQEAELFCQNNNSKLASPTSPGAQNKVQLEIKKLSDSYTQAWWISLTEPERLPRLYYNIYTHHLRFRHHCFSITPDYISYSYCNEANSFICEKHNVTLVERYPLDPQPGGLPCENTSLLFRNKCYTLLNVKYLSYKEANERCHSLRGTLVSISDQVEQDFINTLLPKMEGLDRIWIGLKINLNHSEWIDKSSLSYFNFNPLLQGMHRAININVRPSSFMPLWMKEIIPKPEEVAVKCPHVIKGPNWIPWRNNCYTFQLTRTRWDYFNKGQVSQTCRTIHPDSDILTIRTQQENKFIASQLKQFESLVRFVWLGIFEDENNLTKWYDGTVVQYSNWASGRPVLNTSFMAGLTTDGSWVLLKNLRLLLEFKQQSIVVCKLDKESKQEYRQSVRDLQKYDSLTYEVVTERLSWYAALEECSRRGAHLASVHDKNQHEHLQRIAKTDGFPLWIGLSNQDISGSEYEWSDGTKLGYQPNIIESLSGSSSDPHEAKCLFINPAGEWVRTSCNTEQEGTICYNTSTSTPSQRAKLKSAPVANHCPQNHGTSNWVQHQDHCYLFDETFYNYSIYRMERARTICTELDAQLLTIRTKQENDFLVQHLTDDPLITSQVWLDMKFDPQGRAVSWQDGSTLTYTNLKSDTKPKAAGSEPVCAVMMAADGGGWKTVNCGNTKSRVVCKTQAKSSGSPVAVGLFIVVVLALLLAVGFIFYKRRRFPFSSSSIRYKRTFDDTDSTSIITDAD
ncbi:lymphocyte antigen 75 [Nematolebias whitei]|uniref:lymphocyte antigen 75 n=1 Tax=Nematolebias whitei TaxID=451745 RepID=UPI00189763BB|nr:lymphocyte antigen 75 [Nematolebias whitei]